MTKVLSNDMARSPARSFRSGTPWNRVSRLAASAIVGLILSCTTVGADEAAVTQAAPEPAVCSGAGFVWWNELLAPETEKLTDFYAKVIGWSAKIVDAEDQSRPPATPNDQYTIFMMGDQEVAGLMKANHPVAIHSSVGWFTYIQVADVELAVTAAQTNGGTILRHPIENPDGSRFAVVSDPMGNVFGLVTPKKKGTC